MYRMLLVTILTGASVCHGADTQRPPNIVLILADDLGYTDLGCMGSKVYETPHIDRLAESSVRFSRAYSSHPTCSPSRAALLTGKYPARLGIVGHGGRGTVLAGDGVFVPGEEFTLGEALSRLGYKTAHIGKWHVGEDGDSGPRDQGFAIDIASNDFCCPGSFFYPFRDRKKQGQAQQISAVPDLEDYSKNLHLSQCLASEASKFIAEDTNEPFFLSLWHYAVHTPIEAKREKVQKYRKRITPQSTQRNANYAALVEHLDDAIGEVLDALRENGLEQNTIVIFFSDNDGEIARGVTSNAPLRDGKVSLYEGGIRVPLFIRWPGVTTAGSECETPVVGHDLFPTVIGMACGDRNLGEQTEIDGLDLAPLLHDPTTSLARNSLHWLRYPAIFHYRPDATSRGPSGAILKGGWKMIEFFPTREGDEHRFELYNLQTDIPKATI